MGDIKSKEMKICNHLHKGSLCRYLIRCGGEIDWNGILHLEEKTTEYTC